MRKKAEMENQRYAILDRALKDAQLKERTERQVAAKKRTETLSRLQTLMSEINLQGQDKEEFDFVKAGLSRIADMITQSSSSSDEDTTKEEENPRTPSNSTEETRPRPANLRVERLKMEERGVTTSTKKKKKHKYFSSPVVRKLRMELEEQRGRAEVRVDFENVTLSIMSLKIQTGTRGSVELDQKRSERFEWFPRDRTYDT